MSDKPVAGIVAALVMVPACAACFLGPAIVGSMIAGTWGWFTGNGVLVVTVLVILAGLGAYALKRRQRRQSDAVDDPSNPLSPLE